MRIVSACVILFAVPAEAAPSLDIGARISTARASGEAREGEAINTHLGTAFLFGFDIGYRFTAQTSIGIYAMPFLGVSSPSGCPGNASCSGAGGHAGIELRHRLFANPPTFDAWIAGGLGIDVLQRTETITTRSSGTIFSTQRRESRESFFYGPELLLQAAAEVRLSPSFNLGPWLAVAASQYWGTKVRHRVNGDEVDSSSGGVDGVRLHTWLFAGVRGAFEIRLPSSR